MKTTDEFWFDSEPGSSEEENSDVRQMIRKIVSTYAGAADLRTRSEYLFDAAGELFFAFKTELEADGTTTMRRLYFSRGKLIRVVRGGKNADGKFSAKDTETANDEQETAKGLQNTFARMFGE